MADLKAMSYTEGWGGWKNQLGNITAPTFWRGVSVTALMDLVGGGNSIVAVASDGYEQTFSAAEVGGAIAMYDPVTGDTVTSITGSLHSHRGLLSRTARLSGQTTARYGSRL